MGNPITSTVSLSRQRSRIGFNHAGQAVEQAQHLLRSRGQLLQQGLGLLQIKRVEAFGEPAVDRSEKVTGLIPLA